MAPTYGATLPVWPGRQTRPPGVPATTNSRESSGRAGEGAAEGGGQRGKKRNRARTAAASLVLLCVSAVVLVINNGGGQQDVLADPVTVPSADLAAAGEATEGDPLSEITAAAAAAAAWEKKHTSSHSTTAAGTGRKKYKQQRPHQQYKPTARQHATHPFADLPGKHETDGLVAKTDAATSDNAPVLDFTTENAYTAVTPITWPRKYASEWGGYLAEPYKATTFTATCNSCTCTGQQTKEDGERDEALASSSSSSSEEHFLWTFHDGSTAHGRSASYTYTSVGRFDVALRRSYLDASGQRQEQASLRSVMVKYVRREIRDLTAEDRGSFLDAIEVMYRLPTSAGKLLYGEEYKGNDYFMDMHLKGAGTLDCDHWHDNAGIATHHIGFTLEFEQALQVVDPSVSVPYWEYTMDSEALGGLTDELAESPIFGEDWFGCMAPGNGLHTVTSGRWAYTPVQKDTAKDSVHNPYGLQRSPWNLDPTPYVTRHNRVSTVDAFTTPSCSTLHAAFMEDSLADLNVALNGGTHGPVHIQIGGAWGQKTHGLLEQSEVTWGFRGFLPLMAKVLWRQGFLRFPEDCSGFQDKDLCMTSCPEEIYKANGLTAYDVLVDTSIFEWVAQGFGDYVEQTEDGTYIFSGFAEEEQEALYSELLAGFCDVGSVGDMFTSAAPADPIFWVIHPSMERFLDWRRLVSERGEGEGVNLPMDWTWGYTTGETAGEMLCVCDWSDATGPTDLPDCVEEVCFGHNEDDNLPFSLMRIGAEEPSSFTNAELLAWIHPSSDDLPYMYDAFEWDHCSGYDFFTD